MKFGFNIPTRGPLADPATIVTLAQRGEALGFDYVAIPDHIVIPTSIATPYPYGARKMGQAEFGNCYEPLATMAYLAGATKSIRLLTSVMVLPHRPPVLAAKMLATIDVLSGGRVTVGCGTGWMAEEFAAIGAPPFAERGKVTDEYLAIFKKLWIDDDPHHDGAYARFADISFLPKPLQQPHPPVWMASGSTAAIEWAAGNGHSILMDPHSSRSDIIRKRRHYFAKLEEAGHVTAGRVIPMARLVAVDETAAKAREVARRAAEWTVGAYVGPKHDNVRQEARSYGGKDPVDFYLDEVIMHGTAESVIDQIRALEADAGMTYLMAAPLSRRSFALLTDKVLPRVAA